jgi:hypothetical protein
MGSRPIVAASFGEPRPRPGAAEDVTQEPVAVGPPRPGEPFPALVTSLLPPAEATGTYFGFETGEDHHGTAPTRTALAMPRTVWRQLLLSGEWSGGPLH